VSKPSGRKKTKLRTMGDRKLTIKHPETGKEYLIGSMQIQQLMEFEQWLSEQCVTEASQFIKTAGENLTPADRKELLQDAFERSRNITLGTPEAKVITGSLRGVAQLLFLCIRRLTPTVTMDEVLGLLTPSNLEEVTKLVDEASGLEPDAEGKQ